LFLAEVIAAVIANYLAPAPADTGYSWIRALVAASLAFFILWYASHYLGKHPYRWTVVAVGALFIIYLAFSFSFGTDRGWAWHHPEFASFLIFAHSSIVLNASLAGTWCGRRHHDKFLARKLARLERKAAKQGAKRPEPTLQSQATGTQASAQDSSAPQDLVPFAMNVATQPNGPLSSPHNLSTGDPLTQIGKLAQLRDTGALTEEEFQAKKTEILGRI
jgi:Short C-terminal domain